MRAFGTAPAKLLYEAFERLNAEYFDGRLAAPMVLITSAGSARTFGDYVAVDGHGLQSRIRIAPAVLKRGPLFACDVLLHEMVHAWQHEIDGDGERGYRGHGPRFAAQCNAIGAALGLPEVGVKGRDGAPDCKHWPLNVRPEGYYPEPFVAPERAPKEKAPPAEPEGKGGEASDDDDDQGGGGERMSARELKRVRAAARALADRWESADIERDKWSTLARCARQLRALLGG